MKISIVGGGPAGLYLACSIKSTRPNSNVVVYEARNESVHSYGLGYTLQELGLGLLARLDSKYVENLFASSPYKIHQALIKTHNATKTVPFNEGVSVTRFQLMQYLYRLASQLGVQIEEKKMTPSDLPALKASSDLLVGADGVNGIVRNHYATEFKPRHFTANLKYSWFINESSQVRKEACFYAFKAPEGVVMLTSYPLTSNKQVVIIEMTSDCLNRGHFKGKSPQEAESYLDEVLSQNGDVMALKSAGLPWYSFCMNSVENIAFENVALLGDSAFSFHFSAGQGVTTAFTTGHILNQCLSRNDNVQMALSHYSRTINLSLKEPAKMSYADMKWLEGIDRHFDTTPESELLELFRLKDKYHLARAAS